MPYVLTTQTKQSYLPFFLTLSTLSILILGVAGPSWNQISVPLIKSQSGLVIALDLSPAMNADDIKPSRLQRAIYKINDLLDRRKEGQTALIVFSGDPFVVTPLTDDIETIKTLLAVLETKIMPSGGHQVNKAISKSVELLAQSSISNGSILLITSELTDSDLEKSTKLAGQQGVNVSVLGVGLDESTPVRKEGGGFLQNTDGSLAITTLARPNLIQLARATNGVYAAMSIDDQDILEIEKGAHSNHPSLNDNPTDQIQHTWHDQGYLLVILALPFAALVFRRGFLLLLLFFIPYNLQALSWDDLWKTPDQQAFQLFEEEKYPEAMETFNNLEWQAAANYKAGDFEKAAELYQRDQSLNGLYNYGNAKAKSGDLQSALTAYKQALELQPDHEDTLYNKKIIEDLLKQNQQNNHDNKDQKQDKSKQEQNQNQDQDQQNRNEQTDDNQDNEEQDSPTNNESKSDGEKNLNENSQKNHDNENQNQGNQSDNDLQDPHSQQNENEGDDGQQTKDLNDRYREQIEKEMQEDQKESTALQPTEEDAPLAADEQQRQIDDRWLERIKDDPSALLRRKFLYQYRQQKQSDVK